MSDEAVKDAAEESQPQEAPAAAAEPEAVVEIKQPLDPESALKEVLRTALHNNVLSRGLKESVKALDRKEAHLCVLSSSLDEQAYVKLVTVLAKERQIPLMRVKDSKTLGEWAGLCKYDEEGNAVKIVSCGCVVVRRWGEESEARHVLMEHLKSI